MEFDFSFGGGATGRARQDDGGPFHLLLIGDFSGRAAARARGTSSPLRRPLQIEDADIDRAFAAHAVTLPVGPVGDEELVTFGAVEDLHPDALLGRLKMFEAPRALRAALISPSPSEQTFAAVEAWVGARAAHSSAAASATGGAARLQSRSQSGDTTETAESVLQRLLGRDGSASQASPVRDTGGGAEAAVRSLIESVVRPHVTPDVGARRAPLLAALDEALTADLRALLAAPTFRALEGAWRGAERVIRALDTDADLRIALFDACRQDLTDALPAIGASLESSPLHKLLVGDDRRWSLIAADISFQLTREDLGLLAALGALASRAGGAFVAGATASLLGAPGDDGLADPATWATTADAPDGAFWQALRESPLAPFIGLVLPRVLARLPYGKKTEPIDTFPFEELPAGSGGARTQRVWGGAALAVAQACGAAFREQGWSMDLGGHLEINDLPAHTFDDDGESRLFPCAEVGLGEKAGGAVLAAGVMPLLARRDRGAVRLAGVSSIATPPRPLAGPWQD